LVWDRDQGCDSVSSAKLHDAAENLIPREGPKRGLGLYLKFFTSFYFNKKKIYMLLNGRKYLDLCIWAMNLKIIDYVTKLLFMFQG
jgi:hypothetical protein